jgi:hypothetical protein
LAWSTWSDCDQTFTYDYNKYKNDEATVKIYVRSNEEYPEDREDKPSSNSQRTFPQWKYSFDDGEWTDDDNYDDDEDDNLLDNQDLCLLFKVSIKTLQRYRAIGALPYFTISGKVYYKASDVREFIKERFSVTTLRQFEKEHCTKKKK